MKVRPLRPIMLLLSSVPTTRNISRISNKSYRNVNNPVSHQRRPPGEGFHGNLVWSAGFDFSFNLVKYLNLCTPIKRPNSSHNVPTEVFEVLEFLPPIDWWLCISSELVAQNFPWLRRPPHLLSVQHINTAPGTWLLAPGPSLQDKIIRPENIFLLLRVLSVLALIDCIKLVTDK